MAVLAIIVLFTLFAPALFHTDPHSTSGLQYAPPSGKHFFGTDVNGRDMFSRVVEGARISLLVGLSGALVSFFIGTAYGLIAGYMGGTVDSVMMRLVEILYAIPRLIIIIIASFVFDPILREYLAGLHLKLGFGNAAFVIEGITLVGYSKVLILILALGMIEWLTMARIVRGQVLSLKNQQFVL
ncbi:MAG: peptide/nickel transport system permease protein/oligopeptide transport system permease protein, partial [Chthoniobacteraceae bacterium]|nr:peptide/nickel transport system permease protein/oligopeptide transport system permease protein [Chthoniobacteraceae bacterium]